MWVEVDGDSAAALESELQRELPPGHQLAGMHLKAIARSEDSDDVLFRPESGSRAVYLVHLTWSAETKREWPQSTSHENIAGFLESWNNEQD